MRNFYLSAFVASAMVAPAFSAEITVSKALDDLIAVQKETIKVMASIKDEKTLEKATKTLEKLHKKYEKTFEWTYKNMMEDSFQDSLKKNKSKCTTLEKGAKKYQEEEQKLTKRYPDWKQNKAFNESLKSVGSGQIWKFTWD